MHLKPGVGGIGAAARVPGPGHQDHADEKGDQPGGFEQDETREHADAVAEDDDAEDDPGHRLCRCDAPAGTCAAAPC